MCRIGVIFEKENINTLTDFPPEQAWVLEMINAILIEVLGAIAENERNKIRSRQREVLAEVHCGKRKPVEAIRELGISRSCYYRLYKNFDL